MTLNKAEIQAFLKTLPGFKGISDQRLESLSSHFTPFQYLMGKVILSANNLPSMVLIVFQGQVRVLGLDPRTQQPITLMLAGVGEIIGGISVVRQHAGEIAIASTDTIGFGLPAQDFLKLVSEEPSIANQYYAHSRLKCNT